MTLLHLTTGFLLWMCCATHKASAGAACEDPPLIEFGKIVSGIKSEYEENDRVQYTCDPGYALSGSEWVTCHGKVWMPGPPQCLERPCGSIPAVANAAFEGRSKEKYEPGETVRYQCHEGFQVTGPPEIFCRRGTWSTPPICEEKDRKCGPPPDIEYGDILSFPLPEYDHGKTVKYKCPSFYILEGPEQITCINGLWTNPPVCLAACTASEEDMDRNNIELRWRGERKLYSTSGDFVEFDCKIGHVQDPASSPFRVQCMDGTLEYPRCKPGREGGKCGPPPDIENGDILSFQLKQYPQGAMLKYKCASFYILKGPEQITCIDGQWTNPPVCLAACTTSEEDMDRNNIELTWSGERKLYLKSGDIVEFDCKIGYVQDPASSPFRVQCMDGTLEYPQCKPGNVTCEPPPEIAGGKVQGVKKPRYLPGETAHYQCWQGFQMTGASTVTCKNGTWTERPQCKGKSRKCGPPPDIENGDILSFPLPEYDQGQTVKYKCPSFYILKGPEQITCTDGQWTNPPVCLAACTASEEDMDRNNIEQRWREERKLYSTSGDFIEFDCKIGHVQDPASSPFRVQCMDGTLEYPRCKPGNVTCEPPPEIAGGKVQGVKKPRYLPGETAHYQCWQGFQMTGASTVTCQNGTWTGRPQCKVIGLPGEGGKCGPPPDIENGDILSFQLKQYPQGAMLKYKCASFYILKGPEQITCTDGQWTNPPVCLAACTASEEDMDRNNIELRWRGERKLYSTSGDFIEFDCKIGYVQDPASSPFRVQCMDGTLEYPRCKPGIIGLPGEGGKCGPPPDIENGDILSFQLKQYPQGVTLKYKCASFYILKGPEQITCIDGQWTNPPVCLAACTASEDDMDRNNIELRWRGERKLYSTSGDFVEFDCKIGYVQDPASSPFRVQCMDGTLEYPRCKPGIIGLPGEGGKCGPPPDIENGDILSFQLKQYPEGATLKYKCASFYILKGPEQITCIDGQWTNPPVCLAACTTSEEDMDRNNIELKWSGERKTYLKSGDFVEFDCKIGYVQDPASSPFRVQCMDGTLEYPRCKPGKILCSPPRVPNGNFRPQEDSYREGATITIDCNPGYHLRTLPGKNTAQCTSRGWVPAPDCVEKPCDYPVIENGKISERMAHSYFPMRIGQYVDYHCRNGYLAPNGGRVVRIYCSKGGWNPEPKCLKTCFVTHLENGYFRYNRYTYTEGERIQYVCNQDYRTESAGGEVTCTKNGWSPFPRCIRKNVTCEPPPEIAGGKVQGVKKPRYLPGETAHYQCWQGFQMTGASTVTCQNGTWTEQPQCKGEGGKCGPPPDIENGDILSFQLKQYPEGATLKYKCASFYILKGPEQITCIDGQWTNPPVCLAACTTSEEDMDRNNIELKWSGERKLYLKSGDFVEFDCKIGYVQDPASSPFRVQCMDGTLEYPRCKPGKDCTVLETAMESNNIKLRQPRRRSYTYRSEEYILFTCKDSYHEVSNPEDFNAQCQDGVINYPRCENVTCEPPPEIAGGKVQGVKKPRYLPGETAHYQCWQGFQMTGASTVTCQNGTWTEQPQCKAFCTTSKEDMNRNNIELKWVVQRNLSIKSGNFIEFDCKIGYVQDPASSPFRVQCMDGTLEYPRCKPGRNCILSETAMERNNIKLRWSRKRSNVYRSKETILFKCNSPYREVSNPEDFEAQCQDGVINYPRCGSYFG
nr:complement factor H isoform X2 [Anas platyrhynchos]